MSTISRIETGAQGEQVATKHLLRSGYDVIERNWKQTLGEIDIVAKKNGAIIFVEVKTLAVPERAWNTEDRSRPEDHLTPTKYRKLSRLGELYLTEKRLEPKTGWRIDLIAIDLDPETKKYSLRHLENIER